MFRGVLPAVLLTVSACAPAVQRDAIVDACAPVVLAGGDVDRGIAEDVLLQDAGLPRDIRKVEGSTPPRLLNGKAVQEALARKYPIDLRQRRIGGTTLVHVLVGPVGRPVALRTYRTAGVTALDEAGRDIAATMRFRPAMFGECGAYSIVEIPLVFSVR